MFDKVLVANRGAIAVRIIRTLRELGVASVAVYADEDRDSLHIPAADEAYSLGSGSAADTYLNQDKILSICTLCGAQAVHPGYGFLSENAAFAQMIAAHGVVFIGPQPEHLKQFGLKHEARHLARASAVNLVPGSDILTDTERALAAADVIGYPVMLKSTAGGGGIGMQRCNSEQALIDAFAAVSRLAKGSFGNPELFLEKYLGAPRHVEVQAFGDGRGNVAIIGDRDCSLQRRHQKVIEECPAPNIPQDVRTRLHEQARALLQSVRYESAATVEFLYDAADQAFYFLEVNTRLQVEHGVTELVYGVDLVAWMVRQASGDVASLHELDNLDATGHAVQARVYAEDPNHDFRPTPGRITQVAFPFRPGIRVDTWIQAGALVPFQFDPMIAKVLAHGSDRSHALTELDQALAATQIYGIETNTLYLRQALKLADFIEARMTTATLGDLKYQAPSIDVLTGGASSTIQSFPGRQGYWAVGVPPSGPMDDLSFQLGNRLLGNPTDAAGIEIVLNGPRLRFNVATQCVIAGADIQADIDGVPVPVWRTFDVLPGQLLSLGSITEGLRTYLLVRNGIDTPLQLGSSATFTLGAMGGCTGQALRAGDVLGIRQAQTVSAGLVSASYYNAVEVSDSAALDAAHHPCLGDRHQIRVMLGPHVAPDFFTERDIDRFLTCQWTVHYNSSRTGIRLTGPHPEWARPDGGEAGLHPSNIHDNAYAFGSVDFTGDMPVILGPDGPSLGGFVCPAVVINADRWKLGQLMPGDHVRFVATTEEGAGVASRQREEYVRTLTKPQDETSETRESPVVYSSASLVNPAVLAMTDITIRRAGQEWLLVEFGPVVLDVELHLKVHALKTLIEADAVKGIVEMTPGIRSLQIRYDIQVWNAVKLCARLSHLLDAVPEATNGVIQSRLVRLPLSWEDPACLEAVDKYVQGVRSDAPWCPDNVEFIRRINGLTSKDDVKRIVFDARYLVMGLGDVYLGAPVATPLDPRHRLVTTKYNPARTWTAENSVGIGGSYLCIYGMEGPGGYQFVGRTLQVWNTYQRGDVFSEPWLLRPFDQLQFYPVDAQTLLEMREKFARGEPCVEIEPIQFDAGQYQAFLQREEASIRTFTDRRQRAFDAELADWRAKGLLSFDSETADSAPAESIVLPPGAVAVDSPMSGSVWSLPAEHMAYVEGDETLVVIEAMKSEFEIRAPFAGQLEIVVSAGQQVQAGQTLAVMRPA
ncbi:MAG: urea carboxylase [bacterium]